jgi:hypothetical protein
MILAAVRARALVSLISPPRLPRSTWIEDEIVLPEGTSALPGRVRLWPYKKGVADAINLTATRARLSAQFMPPDCSLGARGTVETTPSVWIAVGYP